MFNTVSFASGLFSNTTTVNVTAGAPYVLFLDGSYTNVSVSAEVVVNGVTRNMPVLPAALVQASESRVIYPPTSKLKLDATGAANSVFYLLRMVVQPTLSVGSSSYV